jgi:deoxyribonuclease V
MNFRRLHPWDVTPVEAMALQERWRGEVVTQSCLDELAAVAGVDVRVRHEIACAAVVVLRYPDLAVQEIATGHSPVAFPYIPGLLAFREAQAILAACEKLESEPDLFIFDGHGIAHPRRLGIASHVGLFLDKPTIGCAKSRLCGEHAEVPAHAGAWVPLVDGCETIGAVVRTRERTNPVYASVGHRVDLETAIRCTLAACRDYRLPEPCRLAHQAAGQPTGQETLWPVS